jgi:tetrahydromethanopterin S-methyltransferase subunit G
MFTTVDIRKLQDRLDEITNKTEVIESEEIAELKAPVEEQEVDEASPEEVTNSGREEDEATRAGRLDRDNIKLDDVKKGIESVLSEYTKDKDEWYGRYEEMENELRAKDPGITDAAIQQAIYDMDDDIVSYVNIDDIEDKISALERLMKTADADGNDIVQTAEFGVGDTVPREELMRDMKAAIKQNHPEVYSKLFMYDIDESKGTTESLAKEGDAELDELKGMLGRSGVMGFTN